MCENNPHKIDNPYNWCLVKVAPYDIWASAPLGRFAILSTLFYFWQQKGSNHITASLERLHYADETIECDSFFWPRRLTWHCCTLATLATEHTFITLPDRQQTAIPEHWYRIPAVLSWQL